VIVVDASVLADALIDDGVRGAAAFAALQRDDQWAGPEHLLVESAAAVRGRWLGGKLREDRAAAALSFLSRAEIMRVDTALLLPRAWELRANLTMYDAMYLAAAEVLSVPLLTADDRLARAPGRRCEILPP
jgi:predicted nucleic acid-binding protein